MLMLLRHCCVFSLQLAHELHAPLRLEKHVSGILLRLEKELDEAEAAIGKRG